jgi:hypothetical protein
MEVWVNGLYMLQETGDQTRPAYHYTIKMYLQPAYVADWIPSK